MKRAATPYEEDVARAMLERGWRVAEVEKVLHLAPGALGLKRRSEKKGAEVHEDHCDR